MTLASMTGFARREGAFGDWSWAVEARSVNGRNLEVRFRGPTGFDSLERPAKEAAQARFQRGQISLALQGRPTARGRRTRIAFDVLERYLDLSHVYVSSGKASAPALDGLLSLPGVIEADDPDSDPNERTALEKAMAASIAEVLDALKQSRALEGAGIAVVLGGFLDRIEALARLAEAEAAQQPELIKARFRRRLTELAGEAASAERIVQEAAAMAIKADVREELDRLASHVVSARGLVGEGGAVGRRLDFLTQEFMREANTLCSKSASSGLTAIGLDLKAVIDQFREQVQNVE
jgi:uncharacterized protein (TIGR00255 family)